MAGLVVFQRVQGWIPADAVLDAAPAETLFSSGRV
jgi:hypothetical protein